MNDPTHMLAGGLVRVAQGLAGAAPTFLVGLMIAGILRFYLGNEGTRRLFGGDSLRRLPQSWLIGMLLPVCSIGVLPILREMRRAGVKPGAMSAFALSAPLFNPLSLLYGLTLSRPLVIILFATGSLFIVTALGILWDVIERRRRVKEDAADRDAVLRESTQQQENEHGASDGLIGIRRLGATAIYLGREATGRSLALAFLGLSGLAILAALLPYGAMQSSVESDDPLAPLTMLCVAIPVYATPMLAMSQLGMMFQHANSPGAAFALLILGTGMNLATPFWFGRHYGWRAAATWMLGLFVIVIGISYAVNKPLMPPGIGPAGHTHAFDIYTNPFSAYHTNLWSTAKELLEETVEVAEWFAVLGVGLIMMIGVTLRLMRIDGSSLQQHRSASAEDGATGAHQDRSAGRFDVIVPQGVLGVTMLIGLIAMSVVACFGYYPPPEECLDQIAIARAECLSAANSGDFEHALYWLPIWDQWSRKLEVGTFLRRGQVRPYQRMQGYLVRKKLELLEHELEHDPPDRDEVSEIVTGLLTTNYRWVQSFR